MGGIEPSLSQGGRKRGRWIKPRNAASKTIKAKYVIIFAKNGNNSAFEKTREAEKKFGLISSVGGEYLKNYRQSDQP